jgi:hypothetical protein
LQEFLFAGTKRIPSRIPVIWEGPEKRNRKRNAQPSAGDGVSRRGDEELGVETRGVRVAAEAGVNDFLGFDPGVLVRNVFDPQVRGFVFDDDNPGGCGHGSGWRSRG